MTGFATAFNEITLVLFTTLAPSGAVAYAVMALVALQAKGESGTRVSKVLLVPFLVSLVGLVASATHLGNPDNALYVFSRVGESPLSTEVFAAVLFLGASGLHWLYQFADHARRGLLNALLVAGIAASLAFVASVAFAYASRTVVTWYMPHVPVALCLNALVGGPILAIVGLRVAAWEPLGRGAGRVLLALSLAALVANIGVYLVQASELATMENWFVTASQLVPRYETFVLAFGVLAAAGIVVDATSLVRGRPLSVKRASIASALVFAGIFVMRFAFYMSHMTTGMSF